MAIDQINKRGVLSDTPDVTVSNSNVNTTTNTIQSTGHGFKTADPIVYSSGVGSPIGGLLNPNNLFVIRVDNDNFKLASTYDDAVSFARILLEDGSEPGGITIEDTDGTGHLLIQNSLSSDTTNDGQIDLTSVGTGDTHKFSKTTALEFQIFETAYPLGTIYRNDTSSANPQTYLKGATQSSWTTFSGGRVIIGVGNLTTGFSDVGGEVGVGSIFESGETGGTKDEFLDIQQISPHQHADPYSETERFFDDAPFGGTDFRKNKFGSNETDRNNIAKLTSREIFLSTSDSDENAPRVSQNGDSKGRVSKAFVDPSKDLLKSASHAHDNMSPYRTVYIWKRIL